MKFDKIIISIPAEEESLSSIRKLPLRHQTHISICKYIYDQEIKFRFLCIWGCQAFYVKNFMVNILGFDDPWLCHRCSILPW